MNKEKLSINNIVLYKNKTIEVTGDIIVPDIKPDIINIINTNGNSYIYKKEITNGKIRLDGNIDTNIIYLADNGETRSISTTLNFLETIEDEKIKEEMKCKYNLKITDLEAKVLNERKITISVKLEIICTFKENKEIEIISNIDEMDDIEKLEEKVNIKNFLGTNLAKTSIKENMKINEEDELAEILKIDMDIFNPENKISYNKVLAKAEVEIRIMYLTEDNKIKISKQTFPIMSFIDIENVKEENNCDIDYKIKNMLITPNSKEQHSILVQIEFEVECEVYESKQINLIKDMYGTKKDISYKEENVFVNIINEDQEKEKIEIEEKMFIEDICKIVDIDLIPIIISKNESNNIVNYEGHVKANILYEVENKQGICEKQMKIPFIIKRRNNEEIKLRIVKKEYNLSNENVNLFIKIEIEEIKENCEKINLINEIKIDDIKEENEYSVIVYFIKPEDTLWEICKRFRVSTEQIGKYNDLENSKIIPGNKLYIVR